MTISGVTAGISAILKAPLGGALFAVEVLYKRDLEIEALIPCIISPIVGYSTFCLITDWTPVSTSPSYEFKEPLELPFYSLLGVVCGLISIIYIKFFYLIRDGFKRINSIFKPAIGALIVGLIGVIYPSALGDGYHVIQAAMNNELELLESLRLVFAKILTTSFTISSGGGGGVFVPSLLIGAMIGSFIGSLSSMLLPSIIEPYSP